MHENYTGAIPGIGALSKLPVFLDLDQKRAVLAGASPGLAWKAELIAAAGADVHVFSPEASADLEALAERGVAAGRLTLHARLWCPEDLAGAALAVGDFEDRGEAECFAAAAKAAGVLVNTVDKPATCGFYFGSIVSRSPVVIGITTDGTAPILGQAIRRKVETVLPPFLADWARHAGSVRGKVKAALRPGAERRRFWERLADLAFAAPPDADTLAELDRIIARKDAAPAPAAGRVSTVEVGSLDADHLTIRDLRALLSADCLLADSRIPPEFLTLARREAARERFEPGTDAPAAARALAEGGRHVVLLVLAG